MTWQTTDDRPTFALISVRIRNPRSAIRNETGPGAKTVVSVTRLAVGASANSSPINGGRLPERSIRLRPSVAAELGELLRLAEHRQRRLRLRIDADQVTPRVGNPEHGGEHIIELY